KISAELPDLLNRHHERMTALDQLHRLLMQLKAAREEKGLSLSDLTELTGMDRSALSKLETGQRANPTVDTLRRYAEAVGKRLVAIGWFTIIWFTILGVDVQTHSDYREVGWYRSRRDKAPRRTRGPSRRCIAEPKSFGGASPSTRDSGRCVTPLSGTPPASCR